MSTDDSPCSLICRICFTVSFKMAHLSGLTLKLSMSLMLAKINSASSSMYLFSWSRFLLSVLLLGLRRNRREEGVQGRQHAELKAAVSRYQAEPWR